MFFDIGPFCTVNPNHVVTPATSSYVTMVTSYDYLKMPFARYAFLRERSLFLTASKRDLEKKIYYYEKNSYFEIHQKFIDVRFLLCFFFKGKENHLKLKKKNPELFL